VIATREARLDDAVQQVYGRSLSDLEAEWQDFLPGYLNQAGPAWARDDLDLWSLEQPTQLIADGKYAEARDLLVRAEAMFASIGRDDRRELAVQARQRAVAGIEAADLTQRGMSALTAGQYQTSVDLLDQAGPRWTTAGDAHRAELASVAAEQAQDGQAAVVQLGEAHRQLERWHFEEAEDLAFQAGQVLAELGDDARTEEAREIMRDAQQLRTRLGLAAAGGGAVGVALLGAGWAASRHRRRRPLAAPPGVAVMERDWSL
jgi:hypothetical protein